MVTETRQNGVFAELVILRKAFGKMELFSEIDGYLVSLSYARLQKRKIGSLSEVVGHCTHCHIFQVSLLHSVLPSPNEVWMFDKWS